MSCKTKRRKIIWSSEELERRRQQRKQLSQKYPSKPWKERFGEEGEKEFRRKIQDKIDKGIHPLQLYDGTGINSTQVQKAMAKKGIEDYGEYIHYHHSFREYRRKVNIITRSQPLHLLKDFDKRSPNMEDYHIDHMFSVYEGYQHKISPFIIEHIENLICLPKRVNEIKGPKCSITLPQLLDRILTSKHPIAKKKHIVERELQNFNKMVELYLQ